MAIQWHKDRCKEEGNDRESYHPHNRDIQGAARNVPGRLLVLLANRIGRKYRHKRRTERAARNHLVDQVRDKIRLQVGIASPTAPENMREEKSLEQSQDTTRHHPATNQRRGAC